MTHLAAHLPAAVLVLTSVRHAALDARRQLSPTSPVAVLDQLLGAQE
jgi:hypothetical protein